MVDKIINDINVSLENKAYLAALALALTLPDICGKAKYPNDNVGKRYKQWYKDYIEPLEMPSNPASNDMPYLSAEVVYQLRCSFLHQGSPNVDANEIHDERNRVDRFALVVDEKTSATGTYSHITYKNAQRDIGYSEMEVHVRHLCYLLTSTAKQYYHDNKSRFTFFDYELVDGHEEEELQRETNRLKGINNE